LTSSRPAAFSVAWLWLSSEMLLPDGIGHLLPCGIPRAHRRDASSSFLQLTFTSRAPAANTIFGDCPPSACGKPLAFAFEILLAGAGVSAATRGRRRTTSRSSSLQRLMLDGMWPASGQSASAEFVRNAGERGSFFGRHTPRRSDPLTLSRQHSGERVTAPSVCRPSTVRNRCTSIRPTPNTLPGLLSPILWSTSLDACEHASLGLPGLVLREVMENLSRARSAFHRRSPGRAPSREPAPATHIRWPTNGGFARFRRCSKTSTRPFSVPLFATASRPHALLRLLQKMF